MSKTVPDAWDDDWVNVADKQQAKATEPAPAPKISKAQRRAQHQEQQRQLWDQAENPGRNLFLESQGVVPLKDEFKPAVKVLSRKPTPAPKSASRRDGTQGDEDEDSEEEARKRAEADFEERKRKAKIEREEKQRKYDEARARIMGTASPATSSRESSQGRANGSMRGGRQKLFNSDQSGV